MSYLINTARVHTLTIGGVDYTDNLVSWNVADQTANRNGLLSTRGSLVLGTNPGGENLTSYRKRLFKRGERVVLDMQWPGGVVFRHPRGHLYVLGVSFNPADDTVEVEIGCRLVLMETTGEIDDLLPFLDIVLKKESQTYSNIAAALAFRGTVVYQNNTGDLVSRRYFYNLNTLPTGFLSILGVTALDVSPLSGLNELPNTLLINYQLPVEEEGESIGDVIIDSETTTYQVRFPSKKLERVPPDDGVPGIGDSSATPRSDSNTTDCGNAPGLPTNDPTAGRENDTESCSSGFKVVDTEEYLPATKQAIQTTYNRGPGGQTSFVERKVYGPAIEVNSQYYTDKYAYCVSTFSSACNPSGLCFGEGSRTVLQSRSTTENFYNKDDGSLIRTVTSNYENIGKAAVPTDWRSTYISGINGVEKVLWRGSSVESSINAGSMYLSSLVIDEVLYQGDRGSTQRTTTYTSAAENGIGIYRASSLDARFGSRTVSTRTSRTISANPLLPDRTNNEAAAAPDTTDETSEFPIFIDTYKTPPKYAGPIVIEESLPVEPQGLTRQQFINRVEFYGRYLVSWFKAEALGLQISEALTPELVTGWYPGTPMRYYDSKAGLVMAAQFDAGAWSVADDGAAVTFKAAFRGISSGSVVLPHNLVGNSAPDVPDPELPPSPTPPPPNPTPPPPVTPGEVVDETTISDGTIAFVVDVKIGTQPSLLFGGKNNTGIIRPWPSTPGENEARVNNTTVCYVNGMVVASGSLISVDGNGGIPLAANNILITDSTTVLDADIFAP